MTQTTDEPAAAVAEPTEDAVDLTTAAAINDKPQGLARLREKEVEYLSWLADVALTEANLLVNHIDRGHSPSEVADLVAEALTCQAIAEHYLRMLAELSGS